MNPMHVVQAIVARRKPRLRGTEAADQLPDCTGHEVANALRFAIRSKVAGATPRSDAWQRLQQRIAQEAVPPTVVPRYSYSRPGIVSPFSPYSAFTRTLLSRFSQLGVALLLLLAVGGDPATLDRLTRPGGRLAHVAAVTQPTPPLPPPVRVNRAALLEASDAAAVDPSAQTVNESDPQPANNYIPSPPLTLITHPRQAVDPDAVRSPLQNPKVDPR